MAVGTILINRSLKLTLVVTTFFTRTRGLYVRLTAGTALGFGGNHSVGFGVGATTVRFLTTVPPLPFFAVMMIWLFWVKTSTQALVVQSAIALAGVESEIKRMRTNKGFMCRHDKWALGLNPVLTALTVDSCDTLSS